MSAMSFVVVAFWVAICPWQRIRKNIVSDIVKIEQTWKAYRSITCPGHFQIEHFLDNMELENPVRRILGLKIFWCGNTKNFKSCLYTFELRTEVEQAFVSWISIISQYVFLFFMIILFWLSRNNQSPEKECHRRQLRKPLARLLRLSELLISHAHMSIFPKSQY